MSVWMVSFSARRLSAGELVSCELISQGEGPLDSPFEGINDLLSERSAR